MDYAGKAEINWPLVAGLGVTAAVLFYALYIVNGAFTTTENAVNTTVNTAASAVNTAIAPFAAISNAITGFFGGNSDSDSDQ
jgi:hypothetical protein